VRTDNSDNSGRFAKTTTELGPVIRSEELDFEFDVGLGGVRLAEQTAIQILGDVKHKPGSAKPQLSDLVRYDKVTGPIDDALVQKVLDQVGGQILATGIGKELYKDPGETIGKEVTYAPQDAVRDALFAAKSAMDADRILINFCGSGQLQVLEVLNAVEQIVLMLDVNTKCEIEFTSLSDAAFDNPPNSASLTVLSIPRAKKAKSDDDEEEDKNTETFRSSTEQAIAEGSVYVWNDSYYVVLRVDVNTATA